MKVNHSFINYTHNFTVHRSILCVCVCCRFNSWTSKSFCSSSLYILNVFWWSWWSSHQQRKITVDQLKSDCFFLCMFIIFFSAISKKFLINHLLNNPFGLVFLGWFNTIIDQFQIGGQSSCINIVFNTRWWKFHCST